MLRYTWMTCLLSYNQKYGFYLKCFIDKQFSCIEMFAIKSNVKCLNLILVKDHFSQRHSSGLFTFLNKANRCLKNNFVHRIWLGTTHTHSSTRFFTEFAMDGKTLNQINLIVIKKRCCTAILKETE